MSAKSKSSKELRWPVNKAWDWYQARPWICGFNFVPSTAINSTEMWQSETFDPETIDRELGWAEDIGFNSCRVFLQYLVWQSDPDGLIKRIEHFLKIADGHKVSVMFCFFDDCGHSDKEPYLGRQDDPIPGVHNSRWTPSPGHKRVVDELVWPQLKDFITAIVCRFTKDQRILAWDIYNEPGNKSLPLLREAFRWARNVKPEQPLTAVAWNWPFQGATETIMELSDIITFHNYSDLSAVQKQVSCLKSYGRPVVCTEWMARHRGSLFQTHLPFFKQEKIGCYCWGLVNGKTQTHFPWESSPDAAEPEVWFHDILHSNGKPYREKEIGIIRKHTQSSARDSS